MDKNDIIGISVIESGTEYGVLMIDGEARVGIKPRERKGDEVLFENDVTYFTDHQLKQRMLAVLKKVRRPCKESVLYTEISPKEGYLVFSYNDKTYAFVSFAEAPYLQNKAFQKGLAQTEEWFNEIQLILKEADKTKAYASYVNETKLLLALSPGFLHFRNRALQDAFYPMEVINDPEKLIKSIVREIHMAVAHFTPASYNAFETFLKKNVNRYAKSFREMQKPLQFPLNLELEWGTLNENVYHYAFTQYIYYSALALRYSEKEMLYQPVPFAIENLGDEFDFASYEEHFDAMANAHCQYPMMEYLMAMFDGDQPPSRGSTDSEA